MSLVFISPLFEIFTPTNSSSIAMVEYDLCRAAQRMGVEPYVIARRSRHEPFDWPRTVLVDYPQYKEKSLQWWLARGQRKRYEWPNLGDHTYARRVARAIAAQKLDNYPLVVHSSIQLATFLRKKFPRAFIAYWCHGTDDFPPGVRQQLKSAVDLAIGVSDFQCRWIQEYFGFEENRVATVYNGIDTTLFTPTDGIERTSTPLTVNYAGRIHPDKGLDVLLRAATKLSPTTPAFEIQVLGSDVWVDRGTARKYRQELDDLIRQLAARGIKVHEHGHVGREQVPDFLRRAQISVVPTRCNEAFGLSTVEGMSCGLATIVANTGGTPEVVGDAALLFERGDADGLAKHLQNLIENTALRQEYSRRGIERARQYPRDRMWARLAEILPQAANPIAAL